MKIQTLKGTGVMDSIDVTEPEEGVEIRINHKGSVIWVNVDGICLLRVCRIKPGTLYLEDDRVSKTEGGICE